MGQCWRCGGELASYAVKCTWCGRSTFVSAFFQVVSLAVVTVALLLITGVLPFAKLVDWYPGLQRFSPRPAASTAEAGPGDVQGGSTLPPGGYGTVGGAGQAVDDGSGAAGRPPGDADADQEACSTGPRARTLALAHPTWTEGDVGLVACRQVRPGFNEAQVRAALGSPREVMEPSGASPVSVWVYRRQRVVFERDTVVGVR